MRGGSEGGSEGEGSEGGHAPWGGGEVREEGVRGRGVKGIMHPVLV